MKKYLLVSILFYSFSINAQTDFKKTILIETHPLLWIIGGYNLGIERQYAPRTSFTFSVFRQRYYPGQFVTELIDDNQHHPGSGYELRIGTKFFLTKLNEKPTRFYLEPQFRVSKLKGSYSDDSPITNLITLKANAIQLSSCG